MSESAEVAYAAAYKNWLEHPDLNLPDGVPKYDVIVGDPIVDVNVEFEIEGLRDNLAEAREKFFFHVDVGDQLQLVNNPIEAVSFEEVEGWREGRLESKNKAFFGLMTFSTGQGDVVMPVACKPYHQWYRGVIHEYSGYEYLNSQKNYACF